MVIAWRRCEPKGLTEIKDRRTYCLPAREGLVLTLCGGLSVAEVFRDEPGSGVGSVLPGIQRESAGVFHVLDGEAHDVGVG